MKNPNAIKFIPGTDIEFPHTELECQQILAISMFRIAQSLGEAVDIARREFSRARPKVVSVSKATYTREDEAGAPEVPGFRRTQGPNKAQ